MLLPILLTEIDLIESEIQFCIHFFSQRHEDYNEVG